VEFAPGDSSDSVKAAVDLAERSDAVLVAGSDALIQAVAAANKNTIVIVNAGSTPSAKPWIDQVPALLSAWISGPESGHALAAVIFGDVNPSGKLPVTLAKDAGNAKAAAGPGIYVGYRYFDKNNIEPLFPFRYALSYSTFV